MTHKTESLKVREGGSRTIKKSDSQLAPKKTTKPVTEEEQTDASEDGLEG